MKFDGLPLGTYKGIAFILMIEFNMLRITGLDHDLVILGLLNMILRIWLYTTSDNDGDDTNGGDTPTDDSFTQSPSASKPMVAQK